ncbi:MAG: dihydrofolate reductase [Candidatus Omnitrophota bacterium]|nr:dihydrofolate reductase [Candidatus Omnitrophota bacterium]MDZ4243460.1 dihydrofolate reductase [Candidatus Omnitrophota bacterium]
MPLVPIRPFSIIVAVDSNFGIGKQGGLPWKLPGDMQHFKAVTTNVRSPGKKNAVVMGRKTWESIPVSFRPLPGRLNVVLSRHPAFLSLPDEVLKAESLGSALAALSQGPTSSVIEQIFVIGGAEVFDEALRHPACQKIFLTKIAQSFQCDRFFPGDLTGFRKTGETRPEASQPIRCHFEEYQRE